ncbi:MAG: hypothetical protein NTZ83_02230 [Candidatus Pacearchaeota archaeon]|nr:hypothetical protein [Candidatus Pacearchaeota archaeon]MCX6750249.1 hypothetical protein [Candidatus Pacearchaeota archaeon]
MNNIKLYLIGAIVLLLTGLSLVLHRNSILKKDRDRQTENIANITKENERQLVLKLSDYKALNAKWKTTLDSTLKANDIALKRVKGATVIDIQYRDTAITKIVYKDAIKLPDGSYKIAAGFNSQCWGFKGEILTNDPKSTVNITEKTANNSIQLVVTKNKYFLGFLWRTHKEGFNAYSDCGKIDITKIDFVK